MTPVGRPQGSHTPGSLRNRIRVLLTDGRPMSAREIAHALGEDVERTRNALTNGGTDRVFRSIRVCDKEAMYTLLGFDVEVRMVPMIPELKMHHRQWWNV